MTSKHKNVEMVEWTGQFLSPPMGLARRPVMKDVVNRAVPVSTNLMWPKGQRLELVICIGIGMTAR